MKVRAALRLTLRSISRETMDVAIARLEAAGFSIVRIGRLAVTVEGEPNVFSDILDGDFEPTVANENGLIQQINSEELAEFFDLAEIAPSPEKF